VRKENRAMKLNPVEEESREVWLYVNGVQYPKEPIENLVAVYHRGISLYESGLSVILAFDAGMRWQYVKEGIQRLYDSRVSGGTK
jgi:hypothetical protein